MDERFVTRKVVMVGLGMSQTGSNRATETEMQVWRTRASEASDRLGQIHEQTSGLVATSFERQTSNTLDKILSEAGLLKICTISHDRELLMALPLWVGLGVGKLTLDPAHDLLRDMWSNKQADKVGQMVLNVFWSADCIMARKTFDCATVAFATVTSDGKSYGAWTNCPILPPEVMISELVTQRAAALHRVGGTSLFTKKGALVEAPAHSRREKTLLDDRES
ncbi:hypothetical protein OIV83_005155 [Microbotryomycetes sp. JL201]|nr:hypothetical protein OIV83_005155 [Microbotryomycetes sp. JL201]